MPDWVEFATALSAIALAAGAKGRVGGRSVNHMCLLPKTHAIYFPRARDSVPSCNRPLPQTWASIRLVLRTKSQILANLRNSLDFFCKSSRLKYRSANMLTSVSLEFLFPTPDQGIKVMVARGLRKISIKRLWPHIERNRNKFSRWMYLKGWTR